MDFIGNSLISYVERLLKDNLYMKLDFEEQEKIEKMLCENVQVFSGNTEKHLGSGYKGVKLKLYDDESFKISSELIEQNEYRGVIKCSRLLVIGTYQMFYCMDYSNIVSDGKNIDNIELLLFNMSMMCMFYHELAHIYRGHLELYAIWKKESSLERHYLDIQTLEWDADSYAATQMAECVSKIRKNLLINDESDFAMKIACGAIHGMTYWQRQEKDFCEITTKEHLPIFYREVTMLKCIGDLCGNLKDVLSYIVGYEREFNKIQGVTYDEAKTYFTGSNGNENYIAKIENNWEKINESLIPFAVFPLKELENFDNN